MEMEETDLQKWNAFSKRISYIYTYAKWKLPYIWWDYFAIPNLFAGCVGIKGNRETQRYQNTINGWLYLYRDFWKRISANRSICS
jgi:hypothetical protein